jgi:hypothetical protein
MKVPTSPEVRDGGTVTYLADRGREPGPVELRPTVPAALSAGAALDLEQAERFLLELDARTAGANAARLAYLIGLSEAHLANMIELVRALAARQ